MASAMYTYDIKIKDYQLELAHRGRQDGPYTYVYDK